MIQWRKINLLLFELKERECKNKRLEKKWKCLTNRYQFVVKECIGAKEWMEAKEWFGG